MSNFINAMQTNDTRTHNGMRTNSTSGDKLVDMFYRMGSARQLDQNSIISMFTAGLGEDQLLALKAMFYNRDVRGGQGERRSFRFMFHWLCQNYPVLAVHNIQNVVKFGRWDDLFVAYGTEVWPDVREAITAAINAGDGLCAKWLPRENKANRDIARDLRLAWGLTPKQYRQTLSRLTKVVENQMCANEWDGIKYSGVPSNAMSIYRNAFSRHDPTGFVAWLEALEKGEETVHAGTLYPHDIISKVMGGSAIGNRVLEQQWASLPNYLPEGKKIFPMIDVSGSMFGGFWGSKGPAPIMVAIALGLYLAERNIGPYKDSFLTFSGSPEIVTVKSKKLEDRVEEIRSGDWGMNTDVIKAFLTMLDRAVAANLPVEDMPEVLLILSDMQFDRCASFDDYMYKSAARMYKTAGYPLPKIVFWNLNSPVDKQSPVKYDTVGTALVSGFSPSIMKSVLTGEFMTPHQVMLDTLNQERYDSVVS